MLVRVLGFFIMKPDEISKKYNCDESAKHIMVEHSDVMVWNKDRGKIRKTDEGFLIGTAPIAKEGVMAYLMADGSIIREFVPKETLAEQSSQDSLKLKPMTNNHPSERRVDSDNASFRAVGSVGENVRMDGTFLMTNFTIFEGATVDEIESGKRELSPGYLADVRLQEGEFEGEKFDAIQVGRTYNHLAVVDSARGGNEIRMQLDAAGKDYGYERTKIKIKNDSKNKGDNMLKVRIDTIDYDAAPEVANLVSKLRADADTHAETVKKANTDLQTMTADRDTLKAKVTELEKVDNKTIIADGVKARVGLERLAAVTVDGDIKVDELDDRELKIKIIDSKFPTISKKIDEKTEDAYIDAVLDSVKEGLSKEQLDSLTAQRKVSTSQHNNNDGAGSSSGKDKPRTADQARADMLEYNKNAWKPKEAAKN